MHLIHRALPYEPVSLAVDGLYGGVAVGLCHDRQI